MRQTARPVTQNERGNTKQTLPFDLIHFCYYVLTCIVNLLQHLVIQNYVHQSGWAPLRPSDSDFSQTWKPGTRETPLLFF
jgi:hypothetical protein